MKKMNIALLTGGDSSEWKIALNGASLVENSLDTSHYNVYKILVRDGRWTYTDPYGATADVDRNDFSLTLNGEKIQLEYALIIIHGTPGEDGHLQGYLEMMRIPYSCCGLSTSVLTFDKSACKRALAGTGIPLAKELLLHKTDTVDPQHIASTLGLPLFVKPNASGSSFGVTKVKTEAEILPALEKAWTESDFALLEAFIEGREISCGVMVTEGKPYIFPFTELVCETEFFDYAAKYEGKSNEITPADFPADMVAKINDMTLRAYRQFDCRGVVRIDFIVKGDIPYFIEVNTIPGMGPQSIIPQQLAAMKMSVGEMYDLIIRDTLQAR